MLVFLSRSLILCLIMLLLACSGAHLSQQEVARDFWTAITANSVDEAKKYTKSDTATDFKVIQTTPIAKVELRKITTKNGTVCIPTTLTEGENELGKTLIFDTILDQENGEWKVDLAKTRQSMLNGGGL